MNLFINFLWKGYTLANIDCNVNIVPEFILMKWVAYIKYYFQTEYRIREAFCVGYEDRVISLINPIIVSVEKKWAHSFERIFHYCF